MKTDNILFFIPWCLIAYAVFQNIIISIFKNEKMFDALNEEIRNAEIYAKTIKQSVFYMEDQPSAPNNSDVWIGGM